MALFQQVEPPLAHRHNPVSSVCKWVTWSKRHLTLARRHQAELAQVPLPRIIHLRDGKKYDYTLTCSLRIPTGLHDWIAELAEDLTTLRLGSRLLLFSGLINDWISADGLHRLFGLIRARIAKDAGFGFAALYAPLGMVGAKAGAFPLHSDLYRGEVLWNVFDHVPAGTSGASTLLRATDLYAALRSIAGVPKDLTERVRATLRGPVVGDGFDSFYQLLHDESNSWSGRLAAEFTRRQFKIKLRKGEGYMLNDRLWLHGRTAPRGGVSSSRLHRLVYCSATGTS